MRVKSKEDEKQAQNLREKEPIEMTSDELLEYALAPELAEKVKHQAKPPDESTDSEQEC